MWIIAEKDASLFKTWTSSDRAWHALERAGKTEILLFDHSRIAAASAQIERAVRGSAVDGVWVHFGGDSSADLTLDEMSEKWKSLLPDDLKSLKDSDGRYLSDAAPLPISSSESSWRQGLEGAKQKIVSLCEEKTDSHASLLGGDVDAIKLELQNCRRTATFFYRVEREASKAFDDLLDSCESGLRYEPEARVLLSSLTRFPTEEWYTTVERQLVSALNEAVDAAQADGSEWDHIQTKIAAFRNAYLDLPPMEGA